MHQKKQLHFYEDQNKQKKAVKKKKNKREKNTQNKNSLHFSFICLIILL